MFIFLIFSVIALYPLRFVFYVLKRKVLIPYYIVYIAAILLSIHYDFIASWPATLLFLITWSLLTIDNKKEVIKKTNSEIIFSLKPILAVGASLIISLLYIFKLDIHQMKDLPLFKVANIKELSRENILNTIKLMFQIGNRNIEDIEQATGKMSLDEIKLLRLTDDQLIIITSLSIILSLSFLIVYLIPFIYQKLLKTPLKSDNV